ncbi:MAG: agmatinase [Microgenomates group bacterium]|jgi:agmatinase
MSEHRSRPELYGTQYVSSYAGIKTFMRRQHSQDLTGVDVVVSGIPFDCAVSNRSGARFGPEAMRSATSQLAWGPIWPWMFDPFDTLAVVDYGDCSFDHGNIAGIDDAIMDHAHTILDAGAMMITMGGDHYVTYPLLKAHAQKFGPLALIQFDAHRDVELSPERRQDHGAMFGYAIADGVVDPKKSLQIGIRTTFPGERTHGVRIMYADEVHQLTATEIVAEIERIVGNSPCYLTFDIDCLDPAFAPGTGTPISGGISSFQALSILRKLEAVNMVGADVVEVSPPFDTSGITAAAGAQIALELICLRAKKSGARPILMPE